MKKLSVFVTFILVGTLFLNIGLVQAKPSDQDLPEEAGTYDVSGHPELKLRVFVHHEPSRPDFNPSTLACNLADPDSTTVDNATGWHLSSTTVYHLNTSSVPSGVGSSNLSTIVNAAFGQWTGASGGLISFSAGAPTTIDRAANDGQNIIAWGRTSGTALAVTYTWYNTQTGEVTNVDTILNKKFSWTWTAYSASACVNTATYDAEDILTHELGHWTGLDDHYSADYINNTMYGYGAKGEIKKDTITTGDSLGLQAIYH